MDRGQRLPAAGAGAALAPITTTGAVAVRRAKEARSMRDASSMDEVTAVEAELQEQLGAASPAGATRLLAGRVFVQDEEGRWMDRSRKLAEETRAIRRFSPAWLDLVRALPELAPVLRGLEEVTVAGKKVNLAFGSRGAERLSDAEIRALVRSFRGA
jgi:hypothetical protein